MAAETFLHYDIAHMDTNRLAGSEVIRDPNQRVFRLAPGDDGFDVAEAIEYEVFLEKKYISETASGRVEEYDLYLDGSLMNLAFGPDASGEMVPTGALREVHDDRQEWSGGIEAPSGFMTVNECGLFLPWTRKLLSYSPSKIVEVGTVAALREHRGRTMTSYRLYHELVANAALSGKQHAIASLNTKLLRLYGPLFDAKPMGPSFDFMGSPTIPIYIDLVALPAHLHSLEDKTAYKAIIEGNFGDN